MDLDAFFNPPSDTPGWWLSVYPEAGEAGGCYQPRRSSSAISSGRPPDPERSRLEAARRARGRMRRYCAANRLNHLGTLTYGPPFCTDPVELRAHVGQFFRTLRTRLGGNPFPYVWVPELHADQERFHVHFAVGKFVLRSQLVRAWGHGFVHIKLLGGLPVGSGALEESRKAANYLSKYVSKSFESPQQQHLHRFDVAQGFQPRKLRVFGRSSDQAIERATAHLGGELPQRVWRSWDEATDWHAPPSLWASW